MNGHEIRHDPTRDPLLRTALEDLEPRPPLGEVDWDALHRSIQERAVLPLARRRRAARWRWAGPMIPAAMAAGLAMLLFFGMGGSADPRSPSAAGGERRGGIVSAEEALRADISDDEFVVLVSGLADPDALLLLAVDEGR